MFLWKYFQIFMWVIIGSFFILISYIFHKMWHFIQYCRTNFSSQIIGSHKILYCWKFQQFLSRKHQIKHKYPLWISQPASLYAKLYKSWNLCQALFIIFKNYSLVKNVHLFASMQKFVSSSAFWYIYIYFNFTAHCKTKLKIKPHKSSVPDSSQDKSRQAGRQASNHRQAGREWRAFIL